MPSGIIVPVKVVDLDTDIGGTDNANGVAVLLPASGGAVVGGTSTNPLRTDPTGTTTQPVSVVGGSLTVDGSLTAVATVTTITNVVHVDDNAATLSIDDGAGSITVDGTFWQATQPISVAALPLPSGAATAAKQPALGTAGTPSADVISVQGVTSMTALKTDGSATTQPISAASLPLPTGASTAANQSTANASLSSIDGKLPAQGQALSAASIPVVLPVAQIATLTPPAAITGFATAANQSTANTSLSNLDTKLGEVQASPTTNTVLDRLKQIYTAITGTLTVATHAVTQNGTWNVTDVSGIVSLPTGASTAAKQPALGIAGTPSADVLTVQGVTSMTALKTDSSATTQPVSAAALPLPSGAATAVNQSAANTSLSSIDGKITAVNTGAVVVSSSALPSGAATSANQTSANTKLDTLHADLASVDGHVDGLEASTASIDTKTPALGQALAAASTPVVLTAAQITTLTPPAAITGFATETTLGATNTEIGGLTETAPASDTASSGLNGRLQRIAQRITSLIALLPTSLSNGFFQVSVKETITLPASQSGTWTVQPGNTANTTAWKVDGSAVTQPASVALPSTIYNGQTNVTTAGTRVTLAASQAITSGVTIRAKVGNTGYIYVGSSAVSSSNGYLLAAGESLFMEIANLNTINLDSSVNGEGVYYIAS